MTHGDAPPYDPALEGANTCADCDIEINDDRVRCAACEDDYAERAHEAMLGDYYGGDTPQTDNERHAAAWAAKRGTR
jgi:hypothetical protein